MWVTGRKDGHLTKHHVNVDTSETITHVSLCAGYGGIDLGLNRAIPNLRTVAFSEIEAFACANLVSKMEAGLLDAAPIWSDLKTFPWAEFRDRVDILSGGYPCQPFSSAGKRLGAEDPRHLWPYIANGIAIMRPRICFFENVEGHVTLGLSTVISDLEELGYRTTWGIFSAAEVGLPHSRRRVFILANSKSFGIQGLWPNWVKEPSAHGHEGEGLSMRGIKNTQSNECATIPCVCRDPYGDSSWVDRMRLLGNGVVPATAAKAFQTLIQEIL